MNGYGETQKTPRHGTARTLGAYLVAGTLLTIFGRLVWAWVVFGFEFGSATVSDFFQALYDPSVWLHQELLTFHQWSLAVALLVVGLLAFLHRKVARGGALLLAVFLLVVSVRELIGLAVSEEFRDRYIGNNNLEVHIIGTWVLALLISVTIIALLLRAGDRPPPGGSPAVSGPGARAYPVSGALMLVLGLASLGWIIRGMTPEYVEVGGYLRSLVDASASPLSVLSFQPFAGSPQLFLVLETLALLALGVLALLRRPVVRGAAMTLSAILLYTFLRQLYGLLFSEHLVPGSEEGRNSGKLYVTSWDTMMKTTEGKLSLLTTVGGLVIVVAVFLLLWRAPEAHPHPTPPPPDAAFVPPPAGQPSDTPPAPTTPPAGGSPSGPPTYEGP